MASGWKTDEYAWSIFDPSSQLVVKYYEKEFYSANELCEVWVHHQHDRCRLLLCSLNVDTLSKIQQFIENQIYRGTFVVDPVDYLFKTNKSGKKANPSHDQASLDILNQRPKEFPFAFQPRNMNLFPSHETTVHTHPQIPYLTLEVSLLKKAELNILLAYLEQEFALDAEVIAEFSQDLTIESLSKECCEVLDQVNRLVENHSLFSCPPLLQVYLAEEKKRRENNIYEYIESRFLIDLAFQFFRTHKAPTEALKILQAIPASHPEYEPANLFCSKIYLNMAAIQYKSQGPTESVKNYLRKSIHYVNQCNHSKRQECADTLQKALDTFATILGLHFLKLNARQKDTLVLDVMEQTALVLNKPVEKTADKPLLLDFERKNNEKASESKKRKVIDIDSLCSLFDDASLSSDNDSDNQGTKKPRVTRSPTP